MAIADRRFARGARSQVPARWRREPASPESSAETIVHTWTRLLAGLWLFGAGIALMVRAELGVSSWDVLHDALRLHTAFSFGAAVVIVSVVVVLGSAVMGVKPGPGTIANVLLVGAFTDLVLFTGGLDSLPAAHILTRLMALLVGVLAIALGTAIYIGAGLGAGPRDSLMLAAGRRLHVSTGTSRALIEGSVLAAGALMGGRVGPGTAVFAIAIGPAINASFRLFGMEPPRRARNRHRVRRAAQAAQRWGRRGQLGTTSSAEKSRYTGGRI
ncbi:MAG: membrane protein [Actinomycetota bacterium]|nr:membrane protein [Actinomycetota bacterium]